MNDDEPSVHGAVPSLSTLRVSFDGVDEQIVALLARRGQLSAAAGELKRANGLPIVDEQREAEAASARAALARRCGVDEALVAEVFAVVVRHSRRAQGPG